MVKRYFEIELSCRIWWLRIFYNTLLSLATNVFSFAIIVLFSVFFSSCSVVDLDECLNKTGTLTTVTREIEAYNSLEIYDNVNVVLEPSNEVCIRVEAGRNILPFIKTGIVNNTLVIRNTMKCNWLRDYSKEITVYLPANNIKKIRYEGSGDVKSSGTLKVDSLDINAWGGSGDITLNIECMKIGLALHYGTVKFDIKGKSAMTTIFANSYGPFYCDKLISDIVFIRNCGINDCYVHAETTLDAEVSSAGNIYYCGNPSTNFTRNGEGVIMRIIDSN